jgi:hypothetical protein
MKLRIEYLQDTPDNRKNFEILTSEASVDKLVENLTNLVPALIRGYVTDRLKNIHKLKKASVVLANYTITVQIVGPDGSPV